MDILYEYQREEPTVEAQSIESTLSLVNSGIGIGLVPSYVKERCHYSNIVYHELPGKIQKRNKTEYNRKICVFYKSGKILNDIEKNFIKSAMNSI